VPRKRFYKHEGRFDRRRIAYLLADQQVRLLRGKVRLRQVTRLTEGEHQTQILTSRCDLKAVEVAYRMFERWRQENFFKYLTEEYAIDSLIEHDIVPDDPLREVPNPARKALDAPIRAARADLLRLQAEYGLAAFVQLEGGRSSMRSLNKTQSPLARSLRTALQRFKDLQSKRAKLPDQIPVRQAIRQEIVRLAPERQHLMNLIKMVAYQAESDLLALVRPHYRRADQEGRTLIQSALASTAEIKVTDSELRVKLHPFSSAHRSQAVSALCDHINRAPAVFPGSRLHLHFSVAAHPI
jgi:hypothetical protein